MKEVKDLNDKAKALPTENMSLRASGPVLKQPSINWKATDKKNVQIKHRAFDILNKRIRPQNKGPIS